MNNAVAIHTVHEAIIRAGCFCGVKSVPLASASNRMNGEAVAMAMSSEWPEKIFGLFDSGMLNVMWFKYGKAV